MQPKKTEGMISGDFEKQTAFQRLDTSWHAARAALYNPDLSE